MELIYLGRERKLRRHRDAMVLVRNLRTTGMPLKDALDTGFKLIDAKGVGHTMFLKPATVLPFRK